MTNEYNHIYIVTLQYRLDLLGSYILDYIYIYIYIYMGERI